MSASDQYQQLVSTFSFLLAGSALLLNERREAIEELETREGTVTKGDRSAVVWTTGIVAAVLAAALVAAAPSVFDALSGLRGHLLGTSHVFAELLVLAWFLLLGAGLVALSAWRRARGVAISQPSGR